MSLAHLEPLEYRLTCRCLRCGNLYKAKVSEKTYQKIITNRRADPPCPKKGCREAAALEDARRKIANMQQIIGQQRAPGRVGSPTATAIDITARTVMNDYKLGDLRSDIRPGETAVPRLPPGQQERADTFFKPPPGNAQLNARVNSIKAAAFGGAYAGQGSPLIDGIVGTKKGLDYTVLNKS